MSLDFDYYISELQKSRKFRLYYETDFTSDCFAPGMTRLEIVNFERSGDENSSSNVLPPIVWAAYTIGKLLARATGMRVRLSKEGVDRSGEKTYFEIKSFGETCTDGRYYHFPRTKAALQETVNIFDLF